MKKVFALLLFCLLLVPSFVLAGQGSTVWYGAWFNDRQSPDVHPLGTRTWIQVSNHNDATASLEITYYKTDGNKYADQNGITVFTHTVPRNGRISWKPNTDLNLAPNAELHGSFIINVTEGSVAVDEALGEYAAQSLNDGQHNTGDLLFYFSHPVQTVTSTFLNMNAFMHYDINHDNLATQKGESITWLALANPSDTLIASATITFYDVNGTAYNTIESPVIITLGPHQSVAFTPGTYGIYQDPIYPGNPAYGSVTIDVTKGSLVGTSGKFFCNTISNIINYSGYGTPLNKRLNIQ